MFIKGHVQIWQHIQLKETGKRNSPLQTVIRAQRITLSSVSFKTLQGASASYPCSDRRKVIKD